MLLLYNYLSLVLVLHQELKYFYFYHQYATEELLSTPKIMTFFPLLPSNLKNGELEWNPISVATIFVYIRISILS